MVQNLSSESSRKRETQNMTEKILKTKKILVFWVFFFLAKTEVLVFLDWRQGGGGVSANMFCKKPQIF